MVSAFHPSDMFLQSHLVNPAKVAYALGMNFMFDTLSLSLVYLVIKLGEFFFFWVLNEKRKIVDDSHYEDKLRDLAPHFRGKKWTTVLMVIYASLHL